MNQQALEQTLGKLVVDSHFRHAFFNDPSAASQAAGIRLTDDESRALTRIRPGALAAVERDLHAKHNDDIFTGLTPSDTSHH